MSEYLAQFWDDLKVMLLKLHGLTFLDIAKKCLISLLVSGVEFCADMEKHKIILREIQNK